MANALTPVVTRFVPAWLLKALTIATNILLQGRVITGGAYSRGSGPSFGESQPGGGVGNLRGVGQGFLGIPIEGAVKKIIVKKGAEHLRDAIDTPEEREIVVKAAVSHGLPPAVASVATSLLTLFSLYLANVDVDKAIANPLWFVKGAALFIGIRILMQWQTPGTTVLEQTKEEK